MQYELIVFQRRAQPVLNAHATREVRVHLDTVMQILLARGFRLLERSFRVLYQFIRLLPVVRIAGHAALHRHNDLTPVDSEWTVKYPHHLMVQGAKLIFGLFGESADADKCPAAQVRKLLRVRIVPFQAIRHALQ